jgi:hypothetical protein
MIVSILLGFIFLLCCLFLLLSLGALAFGIGGQKLRSVQRYAAGEREPPEKWEQIAALIRARQVELADILARIRGR